MEPFSRFADYFLEVAKTANLRKAAEKLHISSSSINRQILLAEEMMAAQLFERLPTGMQLTAAGELLYNDLRRWKKEYARTLQYFDDMQGLKRGKVSLAVVAALSEGPVVNALASLCEDYPGIEFTINTHDSQKISQWVTNTDIDFGLLLDPENHYGLEVVCEVFVPIGAVVCPGHPLSDSPQVTLGQLAEYRLLFPAAPLVVYEHINSACQRSQITWQNAIIANDVHLVRSFAKQSVGVGLLSLLDVWEPVRKGELVFVPIDSQHIRPLRLALCVAPKRQLSYAAQLALRACSDAVKALSNTMLTATGPFAQTQKKASALCDDI